MFDASKEAGMIGVDPRHFEYLLDLQEGLCYMDGHCDRKLIFDPAQHSNKFVIISRCDTLRLLLYSHSDGRKISVGIILRRSKIQLNDGLSKAIVFPCLRALM